MELKCVQICVRCLLREKENNFQKQTEQKNTYTDARGLAREGYKMVKLYCLKNFMSKRISFFIAVRNFYSRIYSKGWQRSCELIFKFMLNIIVKVL